MGPVVVLLTMFFADGYLGGGGPAAEFKTVEECQSFGIRHASQMTNFGHPATFTCHQVRKFQSDPNVKPPYRPPYREPSTVTP